MPGTGRHDGYTRIEAAVSVAPDATWVGALQRAAGGANPIKWQHVATSVWNGESQDAATIRDGLGTQALLITDELALCRDLDLQAAESRLPFAGLVFLGKLSIPGNGLWTPAAWRQTVAEDLLMDAGVGRIQRLRAEADDLDFVRDQDGAGMSVRQLAADLDGSPKKAAKVASQSMLIVLHELDPDHPNRNALFESLEALPMRWVMPSEGAFARARLRAIADTRTVCDGGEERFTAAVEQVRRAAEDVAYGPWSELPRSGGYVRTGDDAAYLRLQLADVVAGYARTAIEQGGFADLVRRFRFVLYNGRRLDQDAAARLDRDRRRYAGLLAEGMLELQARGVRR